MARNTSAPGDDGDAAHKAKLEAAIAKIENLTQRFERLRITSPNNIISGEGEAMVLNDDALQQTLSITVSCSEGSITTVVRLI